MPRHAPAPALSASQRCCPAPLHRPLPQIYPGKVSCSWAGPAGKKQLAKAYIGKVCLAAGWGHV